MRVDKFLKNSRVIKRRTVANEACSNGRVKINDKIAKPGTEVQVGDIITIRYGSHSTRLEVLSIADNVSKADSTGIYKALQDEQTKDEQTKDRN